MDGKQIIKLFSQDDVQAILSILDSNPGLDLHSFSNSKNFTALHFVCFNNNYDLCERVLQHTKRQRVETLKFINWINAQNKEGMTALHLASFKGNYRLITLLQSNGAKHTISTYSGMSVLHMTTQGDSPLTSFHWIERGVSIECEDDNGSTPLSWAACAGQLNILSFLISWGANIDHKDTDQGQTPLHMACLWGHTRIVRKLLIKGANRTLKDNHQKTALDYAIERRYKTIEIMLRNREGVFESCGLKSSYRKIQPSKTAHYVLVAMYLFQLFITILFTSPYVQKSWWLWSFFILSIITIILFIRLAVSDPGRLPKSKGHLVMQLLENSEISTICPDCQIVTPTKHCEICQSCISRYDHHCPWIANCVGQNNVKLFYLFLISFFISVIMQFVMQIQHLHYEQVQYFFIGSDFLLSGKYFTFVVVILMAGMFMIPISLLLWVQTVNIFTGKTTYERFRDRRATVQLKQRIKDKDSNFSSIKIPSSNFSDKPIFTNIEL